MIAPFRFMLVWKFDRRISGCPSDEVAQLIGLRKKCDHSVSGCTSDVIAVLAWFVEEMRSLSSE